MNCAEFSIFTHAESIMQTCVFAALFSTDLARPTLALWVPRRCSATIRRTEPNLKDGSIG